MDTRRAEPGARAQQLIAAGRELLEEGGPEALSMRRLADRVGIRAPSIYKHLVDKEELETALVADGLREFAEACEAAVDGADEPLVALAGAYRAFAGAHPHLYRLINDRPLPRDRLPAGLEDRAGAPLLAAVRGDRDRARAAWAFAHGMVMLELTDRFPADADLEAAWRAGLAALAPGRGERRGPRVRTPRRR